jgi:signal transduction histidine kinase
MELPQIESLRRFAATPTGAVAVAAALGLFLATLVPAVAPGIDPVGAATLRWTVAAIGALAIAVTGVRGTEAILDRRLRAIAVAGLAAWLLRQLAIAAAWFMDPGSRSVIPDLLFLAAVIPLTTWLAIDVRRHLTVRARLTVYLDVAIVMLAVVAVVVGLEPPGLLTESPRVEDVVNLVYPVFIIGAVGGILVGALGLRVRMRPGGVWLVVPGTLVTGVALTALNWVPGADPAVTGGSLASQAFPWALLAVALGAAGWTTAPDPRPGVRRVQGILQHVVPLAGVALGAVMILVTGVNPDWPGTVIRITVATSTGLLVLRQTILLVERGGVLRDLQLAHDEAAAALAENRRLADALAQRVAELEHVQESLTGAARNAAIGELATAVAHEVNNPLTGVLGFSELLLAGRDPDDPDIEELETIRSEALRARGIIRSLVEFSRPATAEARPVELDTVVRETVDLLRYHHTRAGITFVERYDGPPTVELDPAGIGQVVLNLLTNAAEAMSSRGGTITITTRHDDDGVVLTVADDGAGMDAETQARAFELFFTSRAQDRGHGLGLASSRKIVEAHGGTMTLRSAPGTGTVATVRLPFEPPAA